MGGRVGSASIRRLGPRLRGQLSLQFRFSHPPDPVHYLFMHPQESAMQPQRTMPADLLKLALEATGKSELCERSP